MRRLVLSLAAVALFWSLAGTALADLTFHWVDDGKTTKEEVIERYGKPYVDSTDRFGREVMIYRLPDQVLRVYIEDGKVLFHTSDTP